MKPKMFDGMMVEFVKDTDVWLADWHYIDDLCYNDPAVHKMKAELQYRHGHNATDRAEMLGYGREQGRSIYIPKGTVGKIRAYRCYQVRVPLEVPSWILKKKDDERYETFVNAYYARNGKTRLAEIIRLYAEDPPSEYDIFYVADWWAIVIQMWPLDKYYESIDRHHRKYIRGIGLIGNNRYDDRLPDYLEGQQDV